MTDEAIIRRLQARDETGLQALAEAYGDPAMAVAFRILRSREDAEECVQDGLQRVWDSIPPNRPERLRYYFITLVRNRALERWRAARRQKRGGGEALLPMEELAECLAGPDSVEAALDHKLLIEALNRFLGTLPERDRQLFLRRYYYLEAPDALAARFGLSTRHVAVILFRARKKLRDALKKEELL